MEFIYTLAFGTIGGIIGKKCKIPGGIMVGAMIATTIYNVFSGAAFVPHDARVAAQVAAGAFSGCIVTRSDVKRMPKLFGPACWILGVFLAIDLGVSALLTKITSMSLISCYMSLIPGSAVNTPIIAADYGADVPSVAVLQMVRLFAGVGLFPSIICWYGKKSRKGTEAAAHAAKSDGAALHRERAEMNTANVLLTAAVALGFGFFGDRINFPGGALVFSMIAVMCLNVFTNRAVLPQIIKKIAQVVCGCYIGAHIGRADLSNIAALALPAIIIVAVFFLNSLLMGHFLKKKYGYSIEEAMLMETPAGAADMLLISSDVGVESIDLIIIHMIRSIAAVAIYPPLLYEISLLIL